MCHLIWEVSVTWHCSFMGFWREFQKKERDWLARRKDSVGKWTLWLILLHHHTKFGNNVLWFRRHHPNNSPDVTPSSWLGSKNQLTHPDKYSLTFLTFAVTLTLNAVIQFFHRTFWLIMLYYYTKSGCKRTSSLEDIIEIVSFWLHKSSLWPWHWR